jgi:hypothetical protein
VAHPVSEADQIDAVAQVILEREIAPDRWFRLIGVGVSHFGEEQDNPQLTLFGTDDEEPDEEQDELSID